MAQGYDYNSIQQGYQSMLQNQGLFNTNIQNNYKNMLAGLTGYGDFQKQQIAQNMNQQLAGNQQANAQRGMANTTEFGSGNDTIANNAYMQGLDLSGQVQGMRLGVQQAGTDALSQGYGAYQNIAGNALGYGQQYGLQQAGFNQQLAMAQLQHQYDLQNQANQYSYSMRFQQPQQTGPIPGSNTGIGAQGMGSQGMSMAPGQMPTSGPTGGNLLGGWAQQSPVASGGYGNAPAPGGGYGTIGSGAGGGGTDYYGASDSGSDDAGYLHGGKVRGPAGKDKVHARLTKGEYVLSKPMIAELRAGKLTAKKLVKMIDKGGSGKTRFDDGGGVGGNDEYGTNAFGSSGGSSAPTLMPAYQQATFPQQQMMGAPAQQAALNGYTMPAQAAPAQGGYVNNPGGSAPTQYGTFAM